MNNGGAEYTVRFFTGRDNCGLSFEWTTPRTEAALFEDFPWLKQIRDAFLKGGPLPRKRRRRPHSGGMAQAQRDGG